ncbi:uncharacterized protein LOC111254981 [Varroa destructor]|uniref:Uncharacterized protein n=1 Tax=Varroa destructor TaxID=109461 RepID=A0A7M7KV80_VARDE|nr:uncharacterized protein LOC111254981 [Varroa destructor]
MHMMFIDPYACNWRCCLHRSRQRSPFTDSEEHLIFEMMAQQTHRCKKRLQYTNWLSKFVKKSRLCRINIMVTTKSDKRSLKVINPGKTVEMQRKENKLLVRILALQFGMDESHMLQVLNDVSWDVDLEVAKVNLTESAIFTYKVRFWAHKSGWSYKDVWELIKCHEYDWPLVRTMIICSKKDFSPFTDESASKELSNTSCPSVWLNKSADLDIPSHSSTPDGTVDLNGSNLSRNNSISTGRNNTKGRNTLKDGSASTKGSSSKNCIPSKNPDSPNGYGTSRIASTSKSHETALEPQVTQIH